jgi:hypothetical protein
VVGVALGAAAVVNYLDARSLRAGITVDTPQDVAARTNDQVAAKNTTTAILIGAGAASVGASALLLLWPQSPVTLDAVPTAFSAVWRGRF